MCHTYFMDATIVMGKQGRLVIPSQIRGQLGLSAGDQLHLRLTGTRLVIERPEDAVAELRKVAAAIPATRSLVEELLADRRADTKLA
jgi:AbrB family looped-hinge helix DNA binding protein